MIDIVQGAFGLVIVTIFGWIVWESSVMIDEKKQRRHKGLTDYYDNPVRKDNER